MTTGTRPLPAEESEKPTRFGLLYELGCGFAARIELDELFPYIVRKLRELFEAEGASVLLLDPKSGELFFPFVAEEDPGVADQLLKLRFPAEQGIAGWVMRTGVAERVDDVQSDPRFFSGIDQATGFTTRMIICAPLRTYQGVIGVTQVLNRGGGLPFDQDDLAFLEALAGSVAVAIENARLFARVKESEELLRVQVGALRRDMAHRDRFTEMIGSGAAMAEVFRLMESAANSPITVLIEGETGTGKELVARGIHRAGARANDPFLAVNCAALSETLLESELFGHRRGSFTGATQDHRGLFEAAGGGTILLDEVGEMPARMQAKLLRVMQEGEIIPVGDSQPRRVDVRVISATNCNLQAEVAEGRFRRDLYYRLAVFPISLPPLRERRADIPMLVDRVLKMAAQRVKRPVAGLEPQALELLVRFDWPGNIRELENEIERAVALAGPGEMIRLEHLSAKLHAGTSGQMAADAGVAARAEVAAAAPTETPSLRQARAGFEAEYIRRALEENGRNVSHTARALGLSRVMLQKKMKEYCLRSGGR